MDQNTGKVLVVDDEEDIRTILKYEMEDAGHEVLVADSGNNALKVLEQNPDIKIIISDVRMPNGSGIDLLNAIRKKNPDVPFLIFITGYADLSTQEIYAKGANAILNKPIEFPALIELTKHFFLPEKERMGRTYHRSNIKLNVEAKVSGLGPEKETQHNFETANIGRGGMFVIIKDKPLPQVEDHISFKISYRMADTLQEEVIEGIGIVRWVRVKEQAGLPRGIGVEFMNLTDEARRHLINFLCKATILSYIPQGL